MSAPAPQPESARTIDEVIARLDDIIARSIREQSRLGYFAALYRKVTIKVKEGIAEGRFENGPRMERFDVKFANRYLEALDQFRSGRQPTGCWLVSFKAAAAWRPIILQQLLLGMNAHINYDLGIAAAEIAPGNELPSLQHDFDEINTILASLVEQVESEINEVSPWINLLDHIDPKADRAIVNFSMDKARACAWYARNDARSVEFESVEASSGDSRFGNDSTGGIGVAPGGFDLQVGVASDPLAREQ